MEYALGKVPEKKKKGLLQARVQAAGGTS